MNVLEYLSVKCRLSQGVEVPEEDVQRAVQFEEEKPELVVGERIEVKKEGGEEE